MARKISINNAVETCKNPSTLLIKMIVLIISLTFSAILLAIFLRESSLSHNTRDPTSTNSVTVLASPHSSTLNTACTNTLYSSLCFTTLSSIPSSLQSTTTHQILEFFINATAKHVKNSQSKITSLFTDHHQHLNLQEKNALNDCLEMLDLTLYELTQAVQQLQDFHEPKRFYGDIKTLLSAAMTNENTCIEGIEEADQMRKGKGIKVHLQRLLTPISRMISNCLAMVQHMESKNVDARKVMISKAGPDAFPMWMTSTDRKLMKVVLDFRPSVIVANDGTGDFRTISEAIKFAPNMSLNRFVIKIKAGVYEENVEIPREKANIMLAGDGMNLTVIASQRNFFDGYSTFNSATLTVMGDKFLARDLTIINTSGPEKHQAVALRVTSDSAFYKCNISSYQDTLYAHSLRQFYRECTIQGTIDFIFGNAAAVFQNCYILVRKPNPNQRNMITAQGREDLNQNTGILLQNCTILAAPDLVEAGNGNVSTFLGRPWRNYSRTIVMKSYLGDLIHPQGWSEWHRYTTLDTVEYIEYMNVGPGSDTRSRVKWGRYQRNCSQNIDKQFAVEKFLHGTDDWLVSTGFPFFYVS